jgi:hypothetical protein
VVRDTVDGCRISSTRKTHPLPSIGYGSGKLTVTGYIQGVRGGVKSLIVACACGCGEYTVDRQNFKTFKSTRCPVCAKKASSQKRYWKYAAAMPDDAHRTRLLNRLASAISRCHVPNCKAYKHYGKRGISVYQQWRDDRTSFLMYVQTLPGWDVPEYEMDRTDVDAGYRPGNIRFVSRSENLFNKRKISGLEEELASLRSRLRRAEEQVRNQD